MTFMKGRHATVTWESDHRQRCVILSYNSDGEDILGEVEIYMCCTRSTSSISTRSEKVRKRFRRCMQYFIANGG